MVEWGIKDWLESITYIFAIVGSTFSAYLFLKKARVESVKLTTDILQKAWTNEGDVSSSNTHFITFELKNFDGDLVGSLQTNKYHKVLEVHATVRWNSVTLHISELKGRGSINTAIVKVKLVGNNNRLTWEIISGNVTDILPKKTVLWPSCVGICR